MPLWNPLLSSASWIILTTFTIIFNDICCSSQAFLINHNSFPNGNNHLQPLHPSPPLMGYRAITATDTLLHSENNRLHKSQIQCFTDGEQTKLEKHRDRDKVFLSSILASVLLLSLYPDDAVAAVGEVGGVVKDMALPDVRYFIAGGGCAAFSHGIATPIDVVKTRMQADPEVSFGMFVVAWLLFGIDRGMLCKISAALFVHYI